MREINQFMDKNLKDKPKILVVEDEAIIARDLQIRLEETKDDSVQK